MVLVMPVQIAALDVGPELVAESSEGPFPGYSYSAFHREAEAAFACGIVEVRDPTRCQVAQNIAVIGDPLAVVV